MNSREAELDQFEMEWSSENDNFDARRDLFDLVENIEENDDPEENRDAVLALQQQLSDITDAFCDSNDLRDLCKSLVIIDEIEENDYLHTAAAVELLEPIARRREIAEAIEHQRERMLKATLDEALEKLSRVKCEKESLERICAEKDFELEQLRSELKQRAAFPVDRTARIQPFPLSALEADKLRREVPQWAKIRIGFLEELVAKFRTEECNLKEQIANLIDIIGKKELAFDKGLKEIDAEWAKTKRELDFLQKRNDKLVDASRRRDAKIAELSEKVKSDKKRFETISAAAATVAEDFHHNEGVYRALEARFNRCAEAYQVADAHRFKLMELSSVASKKIADLRKRNADLEAENEKLKQDLQLERMANTFEWQANFDELAFPKELELNQLFCDEEAIIVEDEPKSRKRRVTHAVMSTRPSKI